MKKNKRFCTQLRLSMATYKEAKKLIKKMGHSQNQFFVDAIIEFIAKRKEKSV